MLLLGAGLAALAGLGLVRTARDGVLFAGVAFMAAWTAYGVVASLALAAGAALTVPQLVAAAAFVAALGGVLARFVPRARLAAAPVSRGAAMWIGVAGLALVLIYLLALLRKARVSEPTVWDSWAFWLTRAKSIVYFDGIDFGAGGWTSYANPDYPPLAPVQEASVFRFAGSVDTGLLGTQHFLLLVAFVGALRALLGRRVPQAILWPALAAMLTMPALSRLVGSSLADEPLAYLIALAATCAALWSLEREPRWAVLAGVFLAGAALTKNEGVLLGAALGLVMAVAARKERGWRIPLALAAVPIVAIAPWRLWMRMHDVPATDAYRPSDVVSPRFLVGHFDQLRVATSEFPPYVFDLDRWLLAVPLALALAVVLIVSRRRAHLGAFAAGWLAVAFVGNVLVYWVTPFDVHWYIASTADRTSSSFALFACALAPLLLAEALDRRRVE